LSESRQKDDHSHSAVGVLLYSSASCLLVAVLRPLTQRSTAESDSFDSFKADDDWRTKITWQCESLVNLEYWERHLRSQELDGAEAVAKGAANKEEGRRAKSSLDLRLLHETSVANDGSVDSE
jgi:hypothetical protein